MLDQMGEAKSKLGNTAKGASGAGTGEEGTRTCAEVSRAEAKGMCQAKADKIGVALQLTP